MLRTYIILSTIVLLTVAGDYALKVASTRSLPFSSPWFFNGAVLYALPAVGWLLLMQTHSLAQIGVLYSSVTILMLTAVGYFAFGEQITHRQALGIIAALLSVYLMEAKTE